MSRLRLRYRAPRYLDRTLALETGEVDLPGIALEFVTAPSLGGGLDAVRRGDVEAAEVLLGDYVAGVAAGDDRLTALPVFPVRRFAQRYLLVARDGRLARLRDLEGQRIGWPSGAATAAVAVRSLLADARVSAELIRGPVGGGLAAKLDRGEQGEPLPARVAAGELAGIVMPYPIPSTDGGDGLRPLLADPAADERARVAAGGVIPINTVVALRRDVYREHRWLPATLMDGFGEAQQLGSRRLNYLGAIAVGLPWLPAMTEEVDALFGGSAFPYGLERNRSYLAAFCEHAAELGVVGRRVDVEELFPAEVLRHPGTVDETSYGVPIRGTP